MNWSYVGVRALLVVPEDDVVLLAAQRQVDVTRAALTLVELRHERDRLAVQGGDLLGRVLVDAVVVGGRQRLVVEEADLVLAEVALALRALHPHPGVVHVVADVAQQRLDPARAQDRVVDVVLVRRRHLPIPRAPRVLVRRVEGDELQLGAGQGGEPGVGGLGELLLQDAARRLHHRLVVEPHQVALDHRRRRQVRQQPDRVEVQGELHVAVALLPRRHRVPVDRVHVDVDAEQVVAALGAVIDHHVEEVLGVQPLALQPALHVGERDDHRVDRAVIDQRRQLVDGQEVRMTCAHVDPSLIRSSGAFSETRTGTRSPPMSIW